MAGSAQLAEKGLRRTHAESAMRVCVFDRVHRVVRGARVSFFRRSDVSIFFNLHKWLLLRAGLASRRWLRPLYGTAGALATTESTCIYKAISLTQ
jgi:hypothetical protein